MTTEQTKPQRSGLELWEFAYSVFLRILAIFFIIFSLQVWMQAIGVSSQPEMRFDTMASHWKIATAMLCVLHPVTALGLWGLFSWGIAVWLINILVQLNMYLLFSALYGFDKTTVIFHGFCFAVFAIFQLSLRFTNNKS